MSTVSPLEALQETSPEVGTLTALDYHHATVLTNDSLISAAGGVPEHSFLLAVPPQAEELLLLKVEGIAQLEDSRSLRALRESLSTIDVKDVQTRQKLQTMGYSCSVVGSFYEVEGALRFGADMESLLAYSSYKVLRPRGRSLSLIASFTRPHPSGPAKQVLDLGVVRYTDSQRHPDTEAKVFVDVRDFIGKKSALFGATRMGKALTEDTMLPVPLSDRFPEGWARNDQLEVGDQVYSTSVDAVPILSFTDWTVEDLYEVEFANGEVVKTSGGHLWEVKDRKVFYSQNKALTESKTLRKQEKLAHLASVATAHGVTDYRTLEEISLLARVEMGQLHKVAVTSGIEKHLGVSFTKLGHQKKNTSMKDNLYPVVALVNAYSELYKRRGVKQEAKSTLREQPLARLCTTEELFESKGFVRGERRGYRWAVDLPTPSEGETVEVEIDPYLLGYWLGDGTSACGKLAVDYHKHAWTNYTQSDKEELVTNLTALGERCHLYDDKGHPYAVRVEGLTGRLNRLGLLNNKHIPALYKRASRSQRLALLQGLMDSDGSASPNGSVSFGVSCKKLFDDVLELIKSLGYETHPVKLKQGKYRDKKTGEIVTTKISYSVAFTPTDIVFRLPRKADRQRIKSIKSNNRELAISAVRKVGKGKVRCLTVDTRNSLFLVEGFVPTHNSNSIKVLTQQVFEYSKVLREPIGQIIFDPQGEYANENVQDGGALASMGTGKDVVIYRTHLKHDQSYERPLLLNFLEEDNLQLLWDLMLLELEAGMSARANYTAGLTSIDFHRPDKKKVQEAQGEAAAAAYPQLMNHYQRRRLGLYAFLKLCRIDGPISNLYLEVGKEHVTTVVGLVEDNSITPSPTKPGEVRVTSTAAAKVLFEWLVETALGKAPAGEDGTVKPRKPKGEEEATGPIHVTTLSPSWVKDLQEGDMAEFVKQFDNYYAGRTGLVAAFSRLKPLHSTASKGDIRETVWEDLEKGRVIIVDLSRGSSSTSVVLSELLVNSIIKHASERFTSGLEPVKIQVVVEEAHNLFDRNRAADDSTDPWVRLSKEAAKYSIGLLYATQEVSSVDPRILSNTSNWIIAHLNSKKETRELANYYSFEEWGEQIRRSEGKGFVRLKTESSPFIVPVQVHKFVPKRGY